MTATYLNTTSNTISQCLVFIIPFFAAAAVTTDGNGMSRDVRKMMVSE